MHLRKTFTLVASFALLTQMSAAATWLNVSTSPAQTSASIEPPLRRQRTRLPDQLRHLRQQRLSPRQLQLQPGYRNPDDAWLLTSPQFDRLSGAAQNYLLRKYGILKTFSSPTSPAPRPTQRVIQTISPSGDIKVNDPAQDIGDRVQNETCSAAFGSNIVVGYNDGSGIGGTSGLSFSNDGGNTWTETHIPAFIDGATLGDPVVAAGPDGEFYYATLAFNQFGISAVGVTRSDDGGATWSPLVNASTTANSSRNFQDKEWLAVDRSDSPYRGNVYASWTSFQQSSLSILFARSTDGGQTWSEPLRLSRPNTFPQGSFIAVGPDGEVHVAWLEGRIIRVSTSIDGGLTFRRPVIAAGVTNPVLFGLNGGFLSGNAFPSMAVDTSNGPHRGHVYIVFNLRGQGRDASDVFLVKSTNGGLRWSRPVRINDDATETDQWMPSLAVAPNGTLAVMWYDRRNDPINDSLIDVYMTTSTDGGDTFAPCQRVTTGNWMLVPTPLDLRFGYHGDYNQMSVSDTNFVFNWGDDREGDANVFVGFAPITGRQSSPDFVLSSRTLLQNIVPGEATYFAIGSSAVEGFNQPVSLSASPVLPGISYDFSSGSIAPGSDVVFTVFTAADLAPGTYLITVTGRAGNIEHTTNLRLAVYSGDGLQQPPDLVSRSRAGAVNPAVGIGNEGTIHVAWEELDRSANRRAILYSQLSRSTPTFTTPIELSDPESTSSDPVIRIDSSGNINLMWEQFDLRSRFDDVYFSRSTDGGQSFSQPVNVSQTNSSQVAAFAPALAVGADGNLYASWTRFDFNSRVVDVFFSASADGGQSFSDAVNVSQTNDPNLQAFQSAIAVDGDGNVNLLWAQFDRNNFSEDVFFSRSTDGGQTFSQSVNLSQFNDSLVRAFGAVLATDGAGNIQAVWTKLDFDRGEEDIFLSTSADGGETFSPPVNISRTNRIGAAVSGTATMVIDGAGNISIAWIDISANNYDIFYSQSTDGGQTFSAPVNVSSSIGLSFSPDIAVGSGGQIGVVWDDDSDGIGQIFLSISSGF